MTGSKVDLKAVNKLIKKLDMLVLMWNLEIYVRQLNIIGDCHQFWMRKDELEKTWTGHKTFFSS